MFEKKFEVTNSKLAVASKPQNTEKTLFRSKNNALIVSYITQKNKDFKLSIADASGNRIFDANYTSDPVFQKKFDISALPKGEYNVRVVSDEKAYNYAFKK
jgi:predicted phage tail protein